ncbi:MAG: SIMPL domain-containing protein [Holosporales bacterium]|jgi:hypothetical protein|nr:SIMPL domain-containing protein [Holosporales bacterium]
MTNGKAICNLVGITVFGFLTYKAISIGEQHNSYISVNGLSTRYVVSDEAKWILSLITETNDPGAVPQVQRNNNKETVIKFLKKQGFTDDEIGEINFSVNDRFAWSQYVDKTRKRYAISDDIIIKSSKVELVKSSMLKALSMNLKDCTVDNSTKYLYKKLDGLKIEMMEDATRDARNRADHIAKMSGNKIAGVRNIATGTFSIVSADSSDTKIDDYNEGDNSIEKRVRVVIHASFNIK